MNSTLQEFARTKLIEGLSKLPEGWQNRFKLMYGRNGGKRSVEDTQAMPIENVVAEMPEDKLDWAMQQVEKSLKRVCIIST